MRRAPDVSSAGAAQEIKEDVGHEARKFGNLAHIGVEKDSDGQV